MWRNHIVGWRMQHQQLSWVPGGSWLWLPRRAAYFSVMKEQMIPPEKLALGQERRDGWASDLARP